MSARREVATRVAGGGLLPALLLALAMGLLQGPALTAQQFPSLERGFNAAKLYQLGDLDSVNLMNGNLVLRLPIGGSYPVGGALSYSLALVYNSKVWDFQEAFYQGQSYSQALPERQSNAGMGWSLSLGRLLDPSDPANDYLPNQWVYISPDGAEHVFYQGLQTVGSPTADACTSVCYSRDGSYLRMRLVATQRIVEMPDGTRHYFDLFVQPDGSRKWRLSAIRDRFEDGFTDVAIGYSADQNTWTIQDKYGRTQKVIFGPDPSGRYPRLLQRVELAAFGTSTDPAIYTFSYLPPQAVRVPCGSSLPNWSSVTVPLLSSISLPDGTSYGVTYYHPTDGGTCHARGVVSDLILPTRGKIHYVYREHALPIKGCSLREWLRNGLGIASRQFLDAAGNNAGTWTYTSQLSQSPWSSTAYACDNGKLFTPPSEELQVTLTTPLLDKTVHYFSVFPGTEFPSSSSFDERDYGLPFSKLTADASGTRFVSTRTHNCNAAGGLCEPARSHYVRYERDADSRCDALTGPGPDCLNTNRRVVSERTVYDDDGSRFADVNRSDFDGFGHYRTEATDGNFGSGNQRTSFTKYNPNNVLPTTNNSWVLGTYTEQTVAEGGTTAMVQHCFDPDTGFLKRQRTYTAGTSPGATDLLVVNTPDPANTGHLTRQEWYGGDLASQALSLSAGLCNLAPPAAGSAYRLEHTYQYGALRTSQYKDAAGAATGTLAFEMVDRDIDRDTGLTAASRDSADIATVFTYDTSGRLVSAVPQSTPAAAWDKYIYVNAASGSRARVEVRKCSPASTTACTELTFSQVEYDDLGRVARERQRMAGGMLSKRVTTYDLAGNQSTVSELQDDATADGSLARTTYLNYDVFGRPGAIQHPDGAAHNTTLSYAGVRSVSRTVVVGNGQGTETTATTTELYDRQGRLVQVTEPSGTGGASVTTFYAYDVGNRLRQVSDATNTQTRRFSYDNRGFLNWEEHPEKTANTFGQGHDVNYALYDARGHAGRKVDGGNDLAFVYDRAERLTLVRENGGRTLETFTFAGANATGDYRRGKLREAERYNYTLLGTTPYTVLVRETYVYGEVEGRVSSRKTENFLRNDSVAGNPLNLSDSFNQSWSYTPLGEPASVSYPQCAACPVPTPRTVTMNRANGFLTGVPGYASSISYHPNGMINQVVHANSTTDTAARDLNHMRRPRSLGTISTSSGAQLWATGNYGYDGAGNVTAIGPSWFAYDKVSRLVSGTVHLEAINPVTARQQTYSYDTFGNLQSIGGASGRATPTAAATNRLSSAGTVYDAAGNLTAWNGNVYEYDALNQMRRMKSGAEEYLYFYTAGGERLWWFQVGPVAKNRWTLRDTDGKVLREYLFDRAASTWSVDRDYVYRDGLLLAAQTPTGVLHYHVDHLGTPRLVTNAAGQRTAYHVYYPFGEEATAFNQDAERMKFTGHERDLASLAGAGDDLDYMHARHCSPLTGRFLSIDPVRGRPKTPQSWNAFAYVRNNPMSLIDPTGECVWDLCLAEGAVVVVAVDVVASALLSGYVIMRVVDLFDRPLQAGGEVEGGADSTTTEIYTPDRDLPRDASGRATPDTDAPHTQLGRRTSKARGERYPQAREFDERGKPVRDIDFTDHGRPRDHRNPHQHRYDPKTGKRLGPESVPEEPLAPEPPVEPGRPSPKHRW